MDEIYWLWLTFVNGIGPVTGHKLIEMYGTAKRVYEECNKQNISIITCENDTYRRAWESKMDFPLLLYSKGNSDWISMKRIGIVGARRCSATGKLRTISLAAEAVAEKKLVVSGLVKGIDSYAHTAAIPQRYNFPRRNRIIAGLSEKLYVIEAGDNSGTRSTVEATLKYRGEVQYIQVWV